MAQPALEQSRTILVVDDAPMFRELGALFLARLGRVITAESGEEGLALASELRPDVVLLDLVMPGIDGAEVCRRLRGDPDLEDTPVVVLTASPRADDHERAIRAGADQVISKPLSRVALIDAVNRYLCSPVARGMPRAEIQAPVRIHYADSDFSGLALNVSRGGIFVESGCDVGPPSEVSLEFALPRSTDVLTPTAQIVWRRPGDEGAVGLGMRFMRLDGPSRRCLSEFVHQHCVTPL